MKASVNKSVLTQIFDAKEELNISHIKFLQTLQNLAVDYPEELEIDPDEKSYIDKKIKLLEQQLEVIELFRNKKCDEENCQKALNLLDDQIDILESR